MTWWHGFVVFLLVYGGLLGYFFIQHPPETSDMTETAFAVGVLVVLVVLSAVVWFISAPVLILLSGCWGISNMEAFE